MVDEYTHWASELFDPGRAGEKPEALRGVRVLDPGIVVMGPVAATLLAEFGAEVIKIEMPGIGDRLIRAVTPWARFWQNAALNQFQEGRNKYHVTIDLHQPDGQRLFKDLAARSDVVIDNFVSGTMDEWGLGYRQLAEINPGIVYLALTGFGQWGPHSGWPGFDAIAQAVSGLASITGFPEGPFVKSGTWIGDYAGAMFGATAVLAALHWRERSGKGQMIDLSQSMALMRTLDWTWVFESLTGRERERAGNTDPAISPSGYFRCADGMIAIAAAGDAAFAGLCAAIGRPDLAREPRFAANADRTRVRAAAELAAIVESWAAGQTRAQVAAAAQEHGFAAAPVLDFGEIYHDEHYRARGTVAIFDDPVYGEVAHPGPVPKLSATPPRLRWSGCPVGFHNNYVFSNVLGLSAEEIRALEESGVIGAWQEGPGRSPPEGWSGAGRIF